MILAGYSEITNNFDRPVFSGVGLESFFFEDLDSDSDVNDSDLDSDTWDLGLGSKLPESSSSPLVFFLDRIVPTSKRIRFGSQFNNDDLWHSVLWGGISR